MPPPIQPRRPRKPSSRLQPATSARLDALHSSERARISDRQNVFVQAAVGGDRQDPALISPWMQRTQWSDTYLGARRDILVKMTALPNYHSRRWGRCCCEEAAFRL
jgi:hypothetical protein